MAGKAARRGKVQNKKAAAKAQVAKRKSGRHPLGSRTQRKDGRVTKAQAKQLQARISELEGQVAAWQARAADLEQSKVELKAWQARAVDLEQSKVELNDLIERLREQRHHLRRRNAILIEHMGADLPAEAAEYLVQPEGDPDAPVAPCFPFRA